MNLKEIEKQLYTDKYLDEKSIIFMHSIINEIGGFIGSVKGLVLLSIYEYSLKWSDPVKKKVHNSYM